jgi:hypothetical protein
MNNRKIEKGDVTMIYSKPEVVVAKAVAAIKGFVKGSTYVLDNASGIKTLTPHAYESDE